MDVKEATKMHSKDYVSNSSSEQGKSPGKILLQSSWEPLLLLLPFHVSLEQRTKRCSLSFVSSPLPYRELFLFLREARLSHEFTL